MRQTRGGFIFLVALLTLTGIVGLTVVGLSRSLNELSLLNRFVANQQAFHLAEAGLDAELQKLQGGSFPPGSVNVDALLGTVPFNNKPLFSGTYTVTIVDNYDDGNPTHDTDGRVTLVSQGSPQAPGTSETLQVLVQLPMSNPQVGAFDYVVATGMLTVSGSAVLGNSSSRVPLYIAAPSTSGMGGSQYALDATSTVWASRVDFWAPGDGYQDVIELCPNCYNPAIFPVSPPPTPAYNVNTIGQPPVVSHIPDPTVDLNPYYTQALAQQALDGKSYHHITAATTLNGNNYPAGLEGIIYVECGVTLTVKNTVTIKGTIVHEGSCGSSLGSIDLAAGTTLRIQSGSPTDINGDGVDEPPFASGLAVAGGPLLSWKSNATMDVKGFVMAGYYSSTKNSTIASTGSIQGGVIGVWTQATTVTSQSGLQPGVWGPGTTEALAYPIWTFLPPVLTIGGSANVNFDPLPATPPGFPSTGGAGNTKPTILYWSN